MTPLQNPEAGLSEIVSGSYLSGQPNVVAPSFDVPCVDGGVGKRRCHSPVDGALPLGRVLGRRLPASRERAEDEPRRKRGAALGSCQRRVAADQLGHVPESPGGIQPRRSRSFLRLSLSLPFRVICQSRSYPGPICSERIARIFPLESKRHLRCC
jgi:hypothetical protein